MDVLRGGSGVLHHFARVVRGPQGIRVVETCSDEASEMDVVGFYAKVLDVGAHSAVLVAPSCSADARRLLEEYGMELEVVP